MSDTPRTNNYITDFPGSRREPRLLDFARQLERELAEARDEIEKYKVGKVAPADYYSMAEAEEKLCKELAEARAEIERLKAEIRDNNYLAARQIVPAEMAVDDLRAELERKDALIEQMRETLRLALAECWSTCCENEIKAALSAAERGK